MRAALVVLLAVLVGCVDAPSVSVGAQRGALASAGAQITIGDKAELGLDAGTVLFRAGWDQLGKRDEASRTGPMSVAVAHDGGVLILDQVNRRVLELDSGGRPRRSIALPAETTDDIAVHGTGLWALIYEPGAAPGYRVARLGEAPLAVSLDRRIQLVTGLFVSGPPSAPSVWVEQRHDQQTLVVADGKPLPTAAQRVHAPGRVDRARPDERLEAERAGRFTARVFRRSGPGWATRREALVVHTTSPLRGIEELATDERGALFLGIRLGEESGPPELVLRHVRRLMIVHRPGARPLVIELAAEMATDAFRTLAVGRDGSLVQLQTREDGVVVRRWDAALTGGQR